MKHVTSTLSKTNLLNIKGIFEEKTGAVLSSRRTVRRPEKMAAVLVAALVCCCFLAAFAFNLFSSLSGDDLGLSASYEKNGLVSIVVENRSEQDLVFQPKLKLMLWSTGAEVAPISDNVIFTGTKTEAKSTGIMTIDLSKAYDIQALEKPLINDNYYFILTNNNFMFGQDWMCTVSFSQPPVSAGAPSPHAQADKTILRAIPENLQDYFENITFDIDERRALNADYAKRCATLLKRFDGKIVSSVSPLALLINTPSHVIFDSSVSPEEQRLLIGQHWLSSDVNFKLLATKTETALTLSALLPLAGNTDADTGICLPLFYVFTYEKEAVDLDSDYAFLYGQVLPFRDLAKYKVYEDAQYICFEASALIYSDLSEYVQRFVRQNPEIRYDKQVQKRVENIYDYYAKNLGSSLLTRYTTRVLSAE